jgi:hypothetical protein
MSKRIVRFDSYCRKHTRYCVVTTDVCRRDADDPFQLRKALWDLRMGYIGSMDLTAPDFCIRCSLHETEHANGRCLLQATRFEGQHE